MNNAALVEAVEKTLAEAYICANVTSYTQSDPVVAVQIDWGDWKHSHLRANHLIRQIGGTLLSEQVTDSDGSDCYSALHLFLFPCGLSKT